jgi:hypothetical protein
MSTRHIVRAPDRSGQGHDAVWTPGRRWPGGKDVEVEVVDQDECPTVTERIHPDSEEKRTFPHPTQIGRKAWDRIRNDRLLSTRPVGDSPAEAVVLQVNLADALARLADANERIASNEARASLAEREVVKLGQANEAIATELEASAVKIAELEEQLEICTARAESAEEAAGRLTREKAELEEQLTAPGVVKAQDATAKADEPAVTPSKGQAKGSTKRGG